MTVRVYTRVSSRAQADKFSLDAQEAKARHWAAYQNLDDIELYRESGISGRRDRDARPELDRLLIDLQPGDTVVVYALARMGRGGTAQLLELTREIERRGARLVSLTENIDTKTPAGRLLFTLLAAVAEMEVEVTNERAEMGRAQAAAQGIYPHGNESLPLGWQRGPDGRIEIDPEHAESVRTVFRLAEGGTPAYRVAKQLAGMGTPLRGHTRWHHETVARILREDGYWEGHLTYRKRQRPNSPEEWIEIPAPPLLTQGEFEAAQRDRKARGYRNRPELFPLTPFLRCECGHTVAGAANRKPGRTYLHYSCRQRNRGTELCPVHGRANNNWRAEVITPLAREAVAQALETPAVAQALAARPTPAGDPHALERASLERRSASLLDLHLADLITRDEFRARREEVDRRLALLESPAAPPQVDVAQAQAMADDARAFDDGELAELLAELRADLRVGKDGENVVVRVHALAVPVVG